MQDTRLGTEADALAPDGSQIRLLLSGQRGALNHFTLPPGATSTAVAHKTIEELWYFLSGTGQLWRRRGEHEVIVDVGPGSCLNIPTGVHFQFRSIVETSRSASSSPRCLRGPATTRLTRSAVPGGAQPSRDSPKPEGRRVREESDLRFFSEMSGLHTPRALR